MEHMIPIETFLNQSVCAVIITKSIPPYSIVKTNNVLAGWIEQSPQSLIGQPLRSILDQSTDIWHEMVVRVSESGDWQCISNVPVTLANSKQRNCQVLCFPIFSQDCDLPSPHIMSMVIDTELSSSLERNHDIMSIIEESLTFFPTPVWLFDARGHVRTVNSATLRLFQVKTFDEFVDVVGHSLSDIVDRLQPRTTSSSTIARASEQNFSSRFIEQLMTRGAESKWVTDHRRDVAEKMSKQDMVIARVLNRRPAPEQVISVIHPIDETEIILRTTASPITDSEGHIVGAIYLTDDVTQSMLLQGQRDAVLAMTGHDLRNPLTPAFITLQQLQRRLQKMGNHEREIQDIDRVLEQLRRIQRVADDTDAIAATSLNLDDVPVPTCNLRNVCLEVARQHAQRFPTSQLVLQEAGEEIVGVWAQRHIERIIGMLVASATRRSPVGKPVTIRLKKIRQQVKVEVIDQGPLPSPSQLEILRRTLNKGGAALALAEGSDLDFALIQTLLGLYQSKLTITTRSRIGLVYTFLLMLPRDELVSQLNTLVKH